MQSEEEEVQQERTAPEICPRCRADLSTDKPVEPTEDEKREYVRALLDGRPFAKTYALFGGQVAAKFSMLTTAEANSMKEALLMVDHEDQMKSITDSIKIKCLYYCREFNNNCYSPISNPKEWEAEHEKRFGSLGEDVPVLITRVLLEFLRLAEMLPTSGMDKSFWKGAGLA